MGIPVMDPEAAIGLTTSDGAKVLGVPWENLIGLLLTMERKQPLIIKRNC